MKALILAAGYATRLYPLTKDFPKPLLKVGGRTILDRLVDQLEAIPAIGQCAIVTNHRFISRFEQWRNTRQGRNPVDLLDDGTVSADDRLGAIGDFAFALHHAKLDEDLLVAAADNILEFDLSQFVAAFQARPFSHLCVHWIEDRDRLRRTGIATLDTDNRVIEFAEKPAEPGSHWAVPPLYLFPRRVLGRIAVYLASGGSPEAPGHFVEWLCRNEPVYAWKANGIVHDVGTPESLAAVRQHFAAESC